MNHRDIVLDVLNNLGQSPNAKALSSIKRDLWYLTNRIFRQSKGIKDTLTKTITTSMTELLMPDNFFVAEEVQFFTPSNNKFYSQEVAYEKFMKWNPSTETTIESFNELVKSADAPQEILTSPEDIELDGKVGYVFQDEIDMSKLLWKPAINGTLKIYHCVTPFEDIDLDATPHMHFSFYDMLINGCTARGLLRLIKNAKNEVELVGLQASHKQYREDFRDDLSEYAGYVEKRSSTPVMQGFDFLNDGDMAILL